MKKIMELLSYAFVLVFAAVLFYTSPSDGASIAVQTVVGPHPIGNVAANEMDIAWASACATGVDSFAYPGKCLVLWRNANQVSDLTAGVKSEPDTMGRTADFITECSAGWDVQGLYISNPVGWKNATGEVVLLSASPDIEFMVLAISK